MIAMERQLERLVEILDTDAEHAVAWLSDPDFTEIVDLNDLDPIARDDLMFAYGYLRAMADVKGQTIAELLTGCPDDSDGMDHVGCGC